MYVSRESVEETRSRLLRVIREAEIRAFEEAYAFEEVRRGAEPLDFCQGAMAVVRDDEVTSRLVPASDNVPESFALFRFHFPAGLDNSGFVGWLASHLKERLGTGVFVICGQNKRRGGIFDYLGVPRQLRDDVRGELERLQRTAAASATVESAGAAETVIRKARTTEDVEDVRMLLREYAEVIRDTICTEAYDHELGHLLEIFGPPTGTLLLARSGRSAAGCVAFRRIDDEQCEMRRLYVRPSFRGSGVGRRLVSEIVKEAWRLGYKSMELETLTRLKAARALYRSHGFQEITAKNPKPNVIRMKMSIPEC